MLLRFAQWLQFTDIPSALRISAQVYPIILTLHMVGLAFFGGMIFITNMRLLGVSLKKLPQSTVIDALRVPKRWGFLLTVTCGALLASSKAEEYYYNIFFWAKMSLLATIAVHGLIFGRSVYHNRTDQPLPHAKLAGGLSLILWTCVMICGRGIGYVEPNLSKLHAFLTSSTPFLH